MKQPFKELFAFSKAERRGVFVLSLLIIILLLFKIFWSNEILDSGNQLNFRNEVKQWIDSDLKPALVDKPILKTKKTNYKTHKNKGNKLHPHLFDPNQMSYTQWLNMGMTPKQANMIENYKSKGGSFRVAEDLLKIYAISESDYQILEPFININVLDDELEEFETNIQIDLNIVDITEIQSVKGIGPAYAKRIIKYRALLGGYVTIEQLREVYGMDDDRYAQISKSFIISTDSIKTISLNKTDYSKLRRHPYISNDLAYEISSYRKLHGNFKAVEDLNKLQLVNDSLYQKIYLYFAVETK